MLIVARRLVGTDIDVRGAVDAGLTLLDASPFVVGFQSLPDTDFAGDPRVVDGSGNGTADVDIGAYESPGPSFSCAAGDPITTAPTHHTDT